MQVVIERDGQFSVADDAKEWAVEQLIKPLQAREEELNYLLVSLDDVGYTYGDTDELRGTYTGPVLTFTPTSWLSMTTPQSSRLSMIDYYWKPQSYLPTKARWITKMVKC